jgi:hypothetical protein
MIDLVQLGATALTGLPIVLEYVRDIEDFDGPLLSEFRSTEGDTFLHSWCDCNNERHRWLVVRTPRQKVAHYLVGGSTLRDVITGCPDGFVYIVDFDDVPVPCEVWFMHVLALPDNYLPGPRSYYRHSTASEEGYQDVYIGQKWDYGEVATYPKKYLQAYAFHSAFGRGGDPKSLTVDYSLTQGWIFHTMFAKVQTAAHASKRASLDAVAFSSPGYLRFKVDSELAAGLRSAVSLYIAQRHDVTRTITELSAWANGHRPYTNDSTAKAHILKACAAIGLDGEALLRHVNTTQIAAKALASYVERLKVLAKNELSGHVRLVGLTSAPKKPRPPPSED